MARSHPGKTNLSVYVRQELHEAVRMQSVALGLTWAGVVDQALEAWLAAAPKEAEMLRGGALLLGKDGSGHD